MCGCPVVGGLGVWGARCQGSVPVWGGPGIGEGPSVGGSWCRGSQCQGVPASGGSWRQGGSPSCRLFELPRRQARPFEAPSKFQPPQRGAPRREALTAFPDDLLLHQLLKQRLHQGLPVRDAELLETAPGTFSPPTLPDAGSWGWGSSRGAGGHPDEAAQMGWHSPPALGPVPGSQASAGWPRPFRLLAIHGRPVPLSLGEPSSALSGRGLGALHAMPAGTPRTRSTGL